MALYGKDIAIIVLTVLFLGSIGAIIYLAIEVSNCSTSDNTSDYPTGNVTEVKSNERINCFPDQGPIKDWTMTKFECEKRGCIFDLSRDDERDAPCFMHPNTIGYKVYSVATSEKPWSLILELSVISPHVTIFDDPVPYLQFKAEMWDDKHLHVTITDNQNFRYQVPFESSSAPSTDATIDMANFEFSYEVNPFSFKVKRKSTGTVIFDTSMGGFVFSDQFLQISTRLPSQHLYGLGEHEQDSLSHFDDFNNYMVSLFHMSDI